MTMAQNTKYKEKSHNEVMEWLSQSPKHNVMKTLWKELKLQAKKLKDLKSFGKEEWAKIPPEVYENLVTSTRNVLWLCLATKVFLALGSNAYFIH